MRLRTLNVITMGLASLAMMLSTASASVGQVVAGGCHLGEHPHSHGEASWAWLLLLLLPLVLRGRLFGRR